MRGLPLGNYTQRYIIIKALVKSARLKKVRSNGNNSVIVLRKIQCIVDDHKHGL